GSSGARGGRRLLRGAAELHLGRLGEPWRAPSEAAVARDAPTGEGYGELHLHLRDEERRGLRAAGGHELWQPGWYSILVQLPGAHARVAEPDGPRSRQPVARDRR